MNDEKLVIKPKRLKGDDGYKIFSIRIKEDVVVRIDRLASETGHSRNELIGIFINFALDRCVVDEAKIRESSD